jgi:tRNA-Thr(GGU) m(6)t(6)A37 methyltransferase TsaA
MELNVPLHVIGIVRTGHRDMETTPIQAGLNRSETATIEVGAAYAEGLTGLGEFDYAWLITWLTGPAKPGQSAPRDAPRRSSMMVVPYLLRQQQRRTGLFATRSPLRVNPLGLSLVRLVEVAPPVITFAGVDLLDGTAVLDIKPYVTRFDLPDGEPRCGWFDGVAIRDGATPARLADGE